MTTETFELELPTDVTTTVEEHLPDKDSGLWLILANGAGAPLTSRFQQAFAKGLAERGVATTLFNFGYHARQKKVPDRMPKLQAEYTCVAEEVARWQAKSAKSKTPDTSKVFLGGKSMGGRVSTYLAAEGFPCAGLVLLGYPLHPPGKPEKMRRDHFPDIKVPALFVSGTRDSLANQDLMKESLPMYAGDAQVHWVEGGDHSLGVLKRLGGDTAGAWNASMDVIVEFLKKHNP